MKKDSFDKFAAFCQKIEPITSNLRLRDEVAGFLQGLSPAAVKISSYFLLGSIGPKYADTDLGIADKMAVKILAHAFGTDQKEVQERFKKTGDLGDVAYSLTRKKQSTLTLEEVYDTLWKLKQTTGTGSQEKRTNLLAELLGSASALEAKYIMRIALDALRLGVGEMTVIEAFAQAFTGKAENKDVLEHSYNLCTDIGALGESVSSKGLKGARRFSVSLGRPVQMMLAQRVKKVSEILKKIEGDPIAAEEKYDGERVEIHKHGNQVTLFSRRLENITHQYPDLIESVVKQVKPQKAILDGEMVAFKNGRPQPFQQLMQRRRKYKVKEYREKIPVVVFLFDILYDNGKSVLKKPYPKRRELLEKAVNQGGKIKLAGRKVSHNFDDIKKFFRRSVQKGYEGIIVKSTAQDSVYQPGKRGWLWIKWKREYSKGMQESFDVVVVGSYHGRGRRKGGFGALLCAVYDPENDRYESFTKVGTGFTDQQFKEVGKQLSQYQTDEKPKQVRIKKEMEPGVYYQPGMVIEITGAEITRSPAHTADLKKGKGLALRFPRFLRMRTDKAPDQATSVREVKKLAK